MCKRNTELIIALDVDTLAAAARLVRTLGPAVTWYKIGKQLFTRFGPTAVAQLKAAGKRVFLDLKYHDIPSTVAKAVGAAAVIGADLTNVHASGGPAMLSAAAAAAADSGIRVIGVTLLTSLDRTELDAIGISADPGTQVVRLARLVHTAGLAGVVCSALEIAPLRAACGQDFLLVAPGIRPGTSARDDQRRVMTPRAAAAAGADFIVVGRPVTQAADPAAAAAAILADLEV